MVIENYYTSGGGLIMPKAKPTQVIVHRIELQEKERDMMETFVVGKTVNNLLEPAIALGAVWVTYKAAKATHDFVDDEVAPVAKDLWKGVVRLFTLGTRDELFPDADTPRPERW
jgi:hypothetical protein